MATRTQGAWHEYFLNCATPLAGCREHCDAESLAVFSRMLEEADEGTLRVPLLLVLAVRSTELDVEAEKPWKQWLQREDVGRLHLGALSDKAASELVALTSEGGRLPQHVVAFILRQSAGVPLHLEQMTRSLVSSALLYLNEDGSYELEGELELAALPTSLVESSATHALRPLSE